MRILVAAAALALIAGCSPSIGIQQRCEQDGNTQQDCTCFAGVLQAGLSEPQLAAFARLQTVDPQTDNQDEREAARRTIGLDGGLKIAAAAAQCNVTKGWFQDRQSAPAPTQ
ncbi:MAG: hypothetical protein JNJ73_01730 [Hyphomonadaceae bacterium]|nr:hypothetical protein [Hyphomonadaceae bacterium]